MKKRTIHRHVVVALAALLLMQLVAGARPAQQRTRTATKENGPPKLAVIIILDQFRADYLQRFGHLFGPRGFKRLLARGAYFTNANYPYSNTITAVGHASVVSGSIPAIHGIIGNQWYDRAGGQVYGAVFDPNSEGVGGAKYGSSPWKMLTTSLGDQLRMSNNYQSKSIGVSMKDRSATLMAGRHATASYWFNKFDGNMVTSTYFADQLPPWVIEFNKKQLANQYFQKHWERKLPEEAYAIADRDDVPYEGHFEGKKTYFPHLIDGNEKQAGERFYYQLTCTPFSNDILLEFAKTTLEKEHLGKGRYPDFLGVSFSAIDMVGHLFGPYSHEIADIVIRTDETLAELLDAIDRQVGLDNALITLTADHGVAPIPGYSQSRKMGGGRVDGLALSDRLDKILSDRYGPGQYILSLINHQFYLDEKLIAEKKLDIAEVEDFLGNEAVKVPGIATYFTRTRLLRGEAPNTDIGRRVMAAFHAQRSGNVQLLVEPFTLIAEARDEYQGTGHGTPYHYDTHVPIIMLGKGIKPGVYHTPCSPTDIAPTMATLLGIEPPSGSVGRVLTEVLKN